MVDLNLLPWREQYRKRSNYKNTLVYGLLCLFALLGVFVLGQIVDQKIERQRQRNQYLQSGVDRLATTISEVNNLQSQRDVILARMDVIQSLQSNRSQIVHMLDELAQQLPKGVYFDNLKITQDKVFINGVASSNEIISALMNNLESSPWFAEPLLMVVDVVQDDSLSASKFGLEIKIIRPENELYE